MTPRIAIALCLILSLSGASLASGPSEPGSEATDQTESDDQDTAPIDVHRHRPGACPEGPPCKGGD